MEKYEFISLAGIVVAAIAYCFLLEKKCLGKEKIAEALKNFFLKILHSKGFVLGVEILLFFVAISIYIYGVAAMSSSSYIGVGAVALISLILLGFAIGHILEEHYGDPPKIWLVKLSLAVWVFINALPLAFCKRPIEGVIMVAVVAISVFILMATKDNKKSR